MKVQEEAPLPAPADKRALLARLLEERRRQPTFVPSYPQQRLWFLDQLQPHNPVYNVPLGYRLEGPLDAAALAMSLAEIVRRHEILRTVFREVAGELRQVVLPDLRIAMPILDVAGSPGDDEEERLVRAAARQPFDLERGPLLRPLLLRRGPERHTLLLTLHHIVFDGWSAGVLVRELEALYGAALSRQVSPLPALPIQYAEFAHWQQRTLSSDALGYLLDYWKKQLAGVLSLSGVVTDHPRPPVQSYRGSYLAFTVPAEVLQPLEACGRSQGATLFITLLAAFAALLRRYTTEEEIVLGTPIASRNRVELEPLIGFFTNTLVLRIDLAGDPTFPELVARARGTALEAYAHQDLPFERLVDELHPDRDLAQNPLFQVLFSFREGEEEGLSLPGIVSRLVVGETGTAKFDLSLSLSRVAEALRGRLEYRTDLFSDATIERMVRQLQTLLVGIAADPDRRLSDLPLVDEQDRRLLLSTWNDTAVDYPREVRIESLFAARAAEAGDAVALVFDEDELSYHELNARANRLAHHLRRRGVGPDVVVGLHLERSIELVVGLLGILKAGAAYLPLDPSYPTERLSFILGDAGAEVLLTQRHLASQLATSVSTVVVLDRHGSATADESPDDPPAVGWADNLAYLIYTSGSTGRPKGVGVTHRSVVNFFSGMDHALGGDSSAGLTGTWLAVTSVSFDISVLELLWTLSRGFKVVVQDEQTAPSPSVARAAAERTPDFSLFYFGGDSLYGERERYRLLLEGARFADLRGLKAVWTPERHFHAFGGLYPNPAVTGAALATITERLEIRAGSVVLPLHEPLRVAEEWSVVDNLSRGRVGISFASGWHANDFALAPANYAQRKQIMLDGIEEVRRLWRGEAVRRHGGAGNPIELKIFPPPVQQELPVWLTSAGNPETFETAGRIGARVLTHLLGHDLDQLAEKIAVYRASWRRYQGSGEGFVTLMLHTFVGSDLGEVRARVRLPLAEYLRTSFDLLASLGRSLGRDVDFGLLPPAELDELIEQAVQRFAETAALLGTPRSCTAIMERLEAIGIDEVACLIDFGVDVETVLAHLPYLEELWHLSRERNRRARRRDSVVAQLRRHQVSHLQCTPSMARLLVAEHGAAESLAGLGTLLLGGEALPPDLARQLADLGVVELRNMYGPTETTIWSATHRVDVTQEPIPLGRPIANTQLYVLGNSLELAPIGVPGELFIGGEGVTRGYHRRPDLTAARFVPDALGGAPGARLYRTGDLVRYRLSGELEFLGRVDHQVKIRGYRIELGEIEAVLATCPGLGESAVVVRVGESGELDIVAFCVAVGPPPITGALRTHLREKLPDHMVPSAFHFLAAMPLTPNGKLDRVALGRQARDMTGSERPELAATFKPPENQLERTLAEIWAEVLKVDRVGVEDNFFDLGGNSFSIVHVRTRLLKAVGRAPTLVDLFRYPTISALAAAMAGEIEAVARDESDKEKVDDAAQRRREALSRRGQRVRMMREAS